jgi:hypothetical protein
MYSQSSADRERTAAPSYADVGVARLLQTVANVFEPRGVARADAQPT